MSLPIEILVLGALTGLTYGLLALGLVLVYRSSRFVNFAHGEIGAFGAALMSLLVMDAGVPYWFAFPIGLLVGAGMGAFTEAVLVRRLAKAPKLLSMIATLILAQFLLVFALVINNTGLSGAVFPRPSFIPGDFVWGAVFVNRAHIAMAILTPVVVAALVIFFRRSRVGIAIRAAASNPDAAALAGLSPNALATLTWAIAGALSAFTAMLVIPTKGLSIGFALGPNLLLPGLTAAVLARLSNLPRAFVGGVVIGIIEQAIAFNTGSSGPVQMVLFVLVLTALLFQSRQGSRERERETWSSVESLARIPAVVRALPSIRMAPVVLTVLMFVGAGFLPAIISNETAFVLTSVLGFAIVGLSVGYLTGLNGQLALGQFAVAAFGAWASWLISSRTNSFEGGLFVAALVGGGLSTLIGLPALRVKGLFLAVVTLAFALASEGWILEQGAFFGAGVDPGAPIVGTNELGTAREYYFVALVAFAIAALLMRNLRKSGLARRLVSLRDNEDAARAFAIDQRRDTLMAYAVAGIFAGFGGAVYGHSLPSLDVPFFLATESVNVVAMTVIGGVTLLFGPLLGALYVIAIPRLVDLDTAGRALHTFAIFAIVLASPGGLAGLIAPVRTRWVRWRARANDIELDAQLRLPEDHEEQRPGQFSIGAGTAVASPATSQNGSAKPLLSVEGVSKHYGGVTAVDRMDLTVMPGQTVGLVGPNGAGKTTLFEIISGFVKPDSGRVIYDGYDVSRVGPERRADLGMVRSFQEAALFPTITVLETVQLAHERRHPTRVVDAIVGRRSQDRATAEHSRELLNLMGLDGFRDKTVGELSTGTRRLTELTCVLALEPRLLLLDEPAAGVAQRETEALGSLLEGVKAALGTTMIIIEHDIPLLASMSDHMVAMESGFLLVEGTPAEVQSAPEVVESFLGGDLAAVQRSGTAS